MLGVDRDIFVKFCPIQGMWGHRIYKFIKDFNSSNFEYINFENFLCGLRNLCRSDEVELDFYIFRMFDLCDNKDFISKQDLTTMLINMPDIGFSSSQNINVPDKFYHNIKNSIIYCVEQSIHNK